ncbi:hypothetical protein MPTK1_2g06820 [Marchantia polymorpha subsp. ruderalis]|uniref:Uncharacterized protein n=1 Tax=Marchantia polymorpha TaxID=3197 RepID=A0A2R6XDU6_MARPO|nr:hypothetical protein MARPO_0021s0135 [Marchantia polymorpha]BBN01355.1 hypothetical protein Mp_2g06820 [Marchantia polymorpha subsp. ruderalis]|eukprot:PTQ44281.1 hypothetical protein MARPO_0021s0135 [Marchantia polymorpha]
MTMLEKVYKAATTTYVHVSLIMLVTSSKRIEGESSSGILYVEHALGGVRKAGNDRHWE